MREKVKLVQKKIDKTIIVVGWLQTWKIDETNETSFSNFRISEPFFLLLVGNLIIFLSAKRCQRCHSFLEATSIMEEAKINDFSLNSLGTKSQIISTTLRADISMELCDARIGSDGISLSKHISTHTRFDYVFSVRLILKLTRSGNQRRSSGKCRQKVSHKLRKSF